MASRSDELNTVLTVTDKASAAIDRLADDVEALDGRTAEVDLQADDHASDDVKSLTSRLEGLSRQDVTVVLKARADQLEREADKALKALRNVESMDGKTVQVLMDARDNASAKLDSVRQELAALDGDEARVSVVADGLDKVQGKLGELPGQLGAITSAVGSGGIAGAAVAVGAALGFAATEAAEMAVSAKTTASLTGATVEDASRLQAVWSRSGADVNDLNDVLLQMNGVLQQSPEMAAQIGVNLNDGKNIVERFVEVMDKLGRSTLGAAEKAALKSAFFGEEGVRQAEKLSTIIGGSMLSAMNDVADTQIISEEDVAQAVEMKNEIGKMSTELKGAATELGQRFVPIMADLAKLGTSKVGSESVLTYVTKPLEWNISGLQKGIDLLGKLTGDDGMKVTLGDDFLVAAEGADILRRGFDALEPSAAAVAKAAEEEAEAHEDADKKAREQAAALKILQQAQQEATLGALNLSSATGSTDWGKASVDGAVTAFSAYTEQISGLGDLYVEQVTARTAYADLVKAEGFNLDLATAAGQKQRDALREVATVMNVELAAAYKDSNGDLETFKTKANDIANVTLLKLAEESGLTAEQVEALRTQLGLTDGDWEARFHLAGDEEAKIKIGLLQSAIDGLDKDTEVRVNQLIIQGDYQGALATIERWYAEHPVTTRANAVAGDTGDARYRMQVDLNRSPLSVGVDSRPGWGMWDGYNYLRDVFNRNPIRIPVVSSNGVVYHAAGGMAGNRSVAGENFRPEFVDGSMVTGPTSLRPGAKVTSEKSTEALIRELIGALQGGGTGGQTIVNMPAGSSVDDIRRYARRNGYADPFGQTL